MIGFLTGCPLIYQGHPLWILIYLFIYNSLILTWYSEKACNLLTCASLWQYWRFYVLSLELSQGVGCNYSMYGLGEYIGGRGYGGELPHFFENNFPCPPPPPHHQWVDFTINFDKILRGREQCVFDKYCVIWKCVPYRTGTVIVYSYLP